MRLFAGVARPRVARPGCTGAALGGALRRGDVRVGAARAFAVLWLSSATRGRGQSCSRCRSTRRRGSCLAVHGARSSARGSTARPTAVLRAAQSIASAAAFLVARVSGGCARPVHRGHPLRRRACTGCCCCVVTTGDQSAVQSVASLYRGGGERAARGSSPARRVTSDGCSCRGAATAVDFPLLFRRTCSITAPPAVLVLFLRNAVMVSAIFLSCRGLWLANTGSTLLPHPLPVPREARPLGAPRVGPNSA